MEYEEIKKIIKTVSRIAKNESLPAKQTSSYLRSIITSNQILFKIEAHLETVIEDKTLPESVIIKILVALLPIVMSLGWDNGYDDAKHIYSLT